MNTKASDLRVPHWLWFRLVRQLCARGAGRRESGAFLLGASPRLVEAFVLYDDLDPRCLNGGYIRFDGSGYVALAQHCKRTGLKVVGDVHTHPGSWTGQSDSDLDNPMMSRPGHVALIVPRFAAANRFSLRGVGAYVYHGHGRWADFHHHVQLSWL